MKILTIEGNIGSGKSVLMEHIVPLLEKIGYWPIIVKEPLTEWQECIAPNGKSHLENYYMNTSENAFSFQLMCLTSRIATLKACIDTYKRYQNCILVCERSPESGNCVFGEMLVQKGQLTASEQSYLCNLLKDLDPSVDVVDNYTLYIDTPSEICKQRVAGRCRAGEAEIDLKYFEQVAYFYDQYRTERGERRCVTINGSEQVDKVVEKAKVVIEWLLV
jgi:deoxyadenosine/deoxycytidine kinase